MNIFEWEENIPVTANNLNEMQNILNNNVSNGFQSKGTILWTNPSPTSSFASQTITLSSDDYDFLLFVYRTDLTIYNAHSEIVIKGYGGQFDFFSTATANRRWARRFARINDTEFEFQDSLFLDGTSVTTQNTSLIPLYVIGYKTGLFQ